MHNFVIWSLDRAIFEFEVAWWHFKKAFFEMRTFEAFKKAFFEVPPSDFKFKYRMIWASYDKVVHTFWVVYDKGCWLEVTRASLGLPIRFYCRKTKNSSFLQKRLIFTKILLKIASNFATFGSLSVSVFDSENILDPQNVSIMSLELLYGSMALHQSHLECLKWFYSSYVRARLRATIFKAGGCWTK